MMISSQGKKVRVVARVRRVTDLESESVYGASKRSVSVHRREGNELESVSISFGDESAGNQRDTYKLDNCYEGNEDNGLIFTKEVKPLISGVFDGRDATIIAYGARSTGKTYLIQGSYEEPGLAVLAMAEILCIAEENGKSVSVSFFEISQDNVHDLLDPETPIVSVLENAQGKIQLKGLSQVPVTSISDFQNLYFGGKKFHMQKVATETPKRSHKGLIIHVLSCNANSSSVGKMSLVDLAGYEDPRRQRSNGQILAETTRINKSIHALQNVMYALNANECHVPYRESKLTRMLKDSLQGTNRTLVITCLSPTFCQDSIYMLSLASRSCQGNNRAIPNSTKKINSLAKAVVMSSQKSQIPLRVTDTAYKQTGSQMKLLGRKTKVNSMASGMKAKKLFDEASHSVKTDKVSKSKKEISSSDTVSNFQSSLPEEGKSTSTLARSEVILKAEASTLTSISSEKKKLAAQEAFTFAASSTEATNIEDMDVLWRDEENNGVVGPGLNVVAEDFSFEKGQILDKENNSSLVNEAESPPLSIRLQALSNNLKLIYSSTPSTEIPEKNHAPPTPSRIEVSQNNDTFSDGINAEPRTPEKSVSSNISCSPWKAFSAHSSKVKNSLVDEYLKFLNTAEKDDLKKLKGIGDKRATYILDLREESPEPFKSLEDLKTIGLSAKQIKGMLKKEAGELFK